MGLLDYVLGYRRATPDVIRVAVLGALGELVEKRAPGAALEVVWVRGLRGQTVASIVTTQADGTRYASHFAGEGYSRVGAAQVLWMICQSAVGHGAGTGWEATARELAEAAQAVVRAEGLL
jgi:hypothetical protein